jgi:hypothetical protein
MELDEGALMQRFDHAVSDLTPDVVALVEGGRQRGTMMRRRRRIASGAGLLAAAAVTVGAVAMGQGLFDHDSAGPTNPNPTGVEQLVSATPRGLAAAVIDQIGQGDPFAVAGQTEPADSAGAQTQLDVDTAYEVGGVKFEIQVVASSALSQWDQMDGCSEPQSGAQTLWCDDRPLSDGTPALQTLMRTSSDRSTDSPPTYLGIVAVKRDDQMVAAIETVLGRDGADYTADTLPVSLDGLVALVTDPSIGLQTMQGYNEAGKDIEGFKDSLTTSSSGSGSSTETPVRVHREPAPPATTGSN